MCRSTIIGILLLAGFTAFAEPQIQGTAPELAQLFNTGPKTISVAITGEAKILVPARRAVLSLSIATENKSLSEAFRANLELRAKLTDYLKTLGIPEERIQAAKFSSTPQFGIFSSKAKSYRIQNVVRVSVQDEKEFQDAAGVVDKWQEVQFDGVEFDYADKELQKQSVIAKACDNASEKKKIYEDKFGLKLVPVRFDAGDVAQRDAGGGNNNNNNAIGPVDPATGLPVAPAPAASESISSFGEMVLTATVTVEYSVQPK